MTHPNEFIQDEPLFTMTLGCDTEFPRALKDVMLSLELKGEAVFKMFPVVVEGEECWWVELHLYKNREDEQSIPGARMFTNQELTHSFFDAIQNVAWIAIKKLGEVLRNRLHNTQKSLRECDEELQQEIAKTEALETTISELRSDAASLALQLRDRKTRSMLRIL